MWEIIEIIVKQIEVHHGLILSVLIAISSLLLIWQKSRNAGFVISIMLVCLLANHWSCYLLVIAILFLVAIDKKDSNVLVNLQKLLHAYSGSPMVNPATQTEKDAETMSNAISGECQSEEDPTKHAYCFTAFATSQDRDERFKHVQTMEHLALQQVATQYPELQSHVAIQLPNGKRYVLDGLIQLPERDILVEINCFSAKGCPNHSMITSKYQQALEYSKFVKNETKLLWLWVTTKDNVESLEKRREYVMKVFKSLKLDLQIIDESELLEIKED